MPEEFPVRPGDSAPDLGGVPGGTEAEPNTGGGGRDPNYSLEEPPADTDGEPSVPSIDEPPSPAPEGEAPDAGADAGPSGELVSEP